MVEKWLNVVFSKATMLKVLALWQLALAISLAVAPIQSNVSVLEWTFGKGISISLMQFTFLFGAVLTFRAKNFAAFILGTMPIGLYCTFSILFAIDGGSTRPAMVLMVLTYLVWFIQWRFE